MNKPIAAYHNNELMGLSEKLKQLTATNEALRSSIAREKHDNIILQKRLRDIKKNVQDAAWAVVGSLVGLCIGICMLVTV